jgi:hypothetical protein
MKTQFNSLSIAILLMSVCLPSYGGGDDYPWETGKVFVFVISLTELEEAESNYFVAVGPPQKPKPYLGPKKLCKPNKITQSIDCGDGSVGGYVENHYDITIDATLDPVPGLAEFLLKNGETYLTKGYCSATGLSVKETGVKLVGDKKIISYTVRVTGGSGGERPIVIKQYCKDKK